MGSDKLSRRRALQLGGSGLVAGAGYSRVVSAASNEIVVSNVGSDETATYEFTVSGTVERLSSPGGDYVAGHRAYGSIHGWKDGYEFTGEVTSFTHDGPVTVYVNGDEVDPDSFGSDDGGGSSPPSSWREVVVSNVGSDATTTYEFTVGEAVERLDSPSGDYVDGTRAHGSIHGWRDGYRVKGDISSFTHDGPVTVYVDGEAVDPNALGDDDSGGETPDRPTSHELVVSNADFDAETAYEFTVSDAVKRLDSPSGDYVNGTRAHGSIHGWKDGYEFTGEITAFSYDGPLRAYLDGEEVDPDSLGDAGSAPPSSHPTLRKVGHLTVAPRGGAAEVRIRADGRYGVVCTRWGDTGSYLIDLSNPRDPSVAHHLDGGRSRHDTKFDHRNGLYYRAAGGNVQIVDYGYSDAATPTNPRVLDTVSDWAHNVTPHTAASALYTVNYGEDTYGFDVWDTSDPTNVELIETVGLLGNCHSIVVEDARDRLHVAYQTPHAREGFGGYVMYDISDPLAPEEMGRFDYGSRTPYSDTQVGEEAFGYCHHVDYDPRRDVVILGDERLYGPPGGKHVLDVSDPTDVESTAYTLSPNAGRMEKDETTTPKYAEKYDWTGHHFDFVPWGESTYIVSGDWHDGVVLYDVTDSSTIEAVDQYLTDDVSVSPNSELAQYGEPPMTWNAAWDPVNELVFVQDVFTGLYVFELMA